MRNILVILGVVAVGAVVAVAAYERFGTGGSTPAPAPSAASSTGGESLQFSVKPTDMVLGSPDAKLTIYEYASLTCPHCASFHVTTLPQLKRDYIETGLVRLVYRDYPLDGLALRAAVLAHCAGPDRYFGFLDMLFSRQVQWAGAKEPLDALAAIGKMGGIGDEEFKTCQTDKSVEQVVLASALEGERTYKVSSTPSIFIEGKRYGSLPYDQLKAVIDPILASK